jgi:hypothetical protein
MKTALIWGADGEIGGAITSQLAKENWQILAAGRHLESLHDLTEYVYEVDLSDAFSIQSAITAISQEVSEIDLWVYAAGDIASMRINEMQPGQPTGSGLYRPTWAEPSFPSIFPCRSSPSKLTCFTWERSVNACACRDYQLTPRPKPAWKPSQKWFARKAGARSRSSVRGR